MKRRGQFSSSMAMVREAVVTHGARGPSRTGEYQTCCPFCYERAGKPDVHYKLQLNPRAYSKKSKAWGGWWWCHRCEAKGGGDLSWLGPAAHEPVDPNEIRECDQPPEGFTLLTEKSQTLATYVKYLHNRSVLPQALAVGAGACTKGRFAGRVVIPMTTRGGEWKGFSARLVSSGRRLTPAYAHPKYLYPKGMDRKGSLWGADWVPRLKDRTHPLYLVEGVFDALPLYPYGLAAFGKNVTDEQLDLLASLVGADAAQEVEDALAGTRRVVVCLDGDAWRDAESVAHRLVMRGVRATYCHLPPGSDPGMMGWRVRNFEVEG